MFSLKINNDQSDRNALDLRLKAHAQQTDRPQTAQEWHTGMAEPDMALDGNGRADTPRRRTTWRDVAGLLAVPVILGACAVLLYLAVR